MGTEDKRVKKLFVANTVDNVKKENNLKLNNSRGLAFVKKAGIANLTVGEIILNDKFKKDGQKIVAWRVILSEGDKKLRAIGFNN